MKVAITRTAAPGRRLSVIATFVSVAALTSSCSLLTSDSPPIPPGRTGLAAQAWIVQQPDVVAFVRTHGGPAVNDFVQIGSVPVVVARLTWTRQNLPSVAEYNIVVLDPSEQDASVDVQTEGAGGRVAIGWDGRFQVLSERYPFLAATRDVQVSGGFTDATGISFRPTFDAPMWIIARFPRNSAIEVAKPGASPIVAAFLTGTDQKVWWALPLTSHPLT
jgi:hypothetical protein